MRINKSTIKATIIVICLILLVIPSKAMDIFPYSEKVKIAVAIIIYLIFFVSMIGKTYDDLKKNEFTTTVYLVLLDIVRIIVYLAVLWYLSRPGINVKVFLILNFFFFGTVLAEIPLKHERFKKKH